MAKIPLGQVSIIYKGAWDKTKTYSRNHAVSTSDSSYVSLKDNNTGHEVTDTEWWYPSALGTQATDAAEKATAAAKAANDAATTLAPTIEELQDKIEKVDALANLQPRYFVGGWVDNNLDAEASETHGDKSVLQDLYRPVLIDHTDNTAGELNKARVLKQNNTFRYDDGTFAPAVGITETERAECDVELYLDAEGANKYCDAGAFDAEAFYNEYGVTQKLYNASGEEVRVLRPWETTRTDLSIMIANIKPVMYLGDAIGNTGKRWKGAFLSGTDWDGIDLTKWTLQPTAFSPTGVGTISGKTRSFFFDYAIGDTNSRGAAGLNSAWKVFTGDGFYPRTNDCQQPTIMQWARANNSDAKASVPFAEGGYFAYDVFNGIHEALYGTNYIHDPNLFSSGVSSNDTCTDEATWKANGGTRTRAVGTETWQYKNWGESGQMWYSSAKGSNMSEMLNQYWAKEKVNESLMVASYINETGQAEGEEFELYGSTYYYNKVSGALGDGINMRIYRVVRTTLSGYTTAGVAQDFEVELILRFGLLDGCSHSGDVWKYCGGGASAIGTCAKTTSGSVGNPVDLYIQPDQSQWTYETVTTKNNLGKWDLEDSYIYMGRSTNLGDGYTSKRMAFMPWQTKKGGSISNGMCFYSYNNNYWSTTLNQRVQVALRFGGIATDSYCARRFLTALSAWSTPYRSFGGFAQVLIDPQVGVNEPQA